MIYQAQQLKNILKYLTLAGVNNDGELEFIGTAGQWDIALSDCDVKESDIKVPYLGEFMESDPFWKMINK